MGLEGLVHLLHQCIDLLIKNDIFLFLSTAIAKNLTAAEIKGLRTILQTYITQLKDLEVPWSTIGPTGDLADNANRQK